MISALFHIGGVAFDATRIRLVAAFDQIQRAQSLQRLDYVLPRDVCNGLEDSTNANWQYWDGKILQGADGKFHMYAGRWPQNKGFADWPNSVIVEAVSVPLGSGTTAHWAAICASPSRSGCASSCRVVAWGASPVGGTDTSW